ncbi:pilus assembly protein PilY [Psychrobacter sp.]|uniref:pilus assembly protein PilY n=1 Tax=Psychrobacter sp. TaxID=56811 RepID=UPI003566BB5B
MKKLQNNSFSRRTWPIKLLSAAVVIGMTGTMVQAANPNHKPIGDLEIYTPAKPGTATLFMMLDISGSMGDSFIDEDYGSKYSSCSSSNVSEIKSEKIRSVIYKRKYKRTITGDLFRDDDGNLVKIKDLDNIYKEYSFTPKGCTKSSPTRYSRLVRLQIALIELLADEVYKTGTDGSLKKTGSLEDDYEVGIGSYTGSDGRVKVPTRALTPEQRAELIESVEGLRAGGGTPSAYALAESGAYMMGTTTYSWSTRNNSGFKDSISSSKDGDNYISPLSTNECSGNGIYLLTDGVPNNTDGKDLMNLSLKGGTKPLSVGTCSGLTGGASKAWGCMGDYAALLRNPVNNKLNLSIKTATVGFGSTFAGLTKKKTIIVNGESKEIIDCDSGSANDNTRNLCKLGERRGDADTKTFGDGGFYYTEESEDIANSIVDFASGLVQIINTAPSGTITIPDDPYRASNQLAYAYLPMLNPEVATSDSIWKGNLKKYKLDQGTLFGNGSKLLYKDIAGNLDENTQDVWQKTDFTVDGKVANNNITAGGVYAQLKSPSSGLSSLRTLYVEDYTSKDSKIPTLRKVSVDGNGKPQGFDQLIDTGTYTEINKRRLLSFLGFDVVLTDNGKETEVEKLKLSKPTKEVKVLGGVVHSKPAAISYSATLDDNGRITNTRDDYVLFGSMDGALHLVDADKGEETYAIIPKKMLEDQPTALVDNSSKAKVGEPYFGVDAPWLVVTDYNYDLAAKRVKVDASSGKGMFAYGGLRMGGEAFYGMDITDKATPKVMFTLTPEGRNNATGNNDFARLGQIWSKPTAAKIRLKKDDKPTNVLIFGGGYDIAYENDEYMATTKAPAKGNAVYMIDASDGKLLWSTSGETGGSLNTKTADMIHSITGEIAVLDRDNDGLMDHIYVADLGGQVFRADFENARPEKFGFEAVTKFSNKRVTRVLNSKPSGKPAYRFYERPVVSFYRNKSTGSNNGQLFALVNVISGNRSAPLSTLRSDNTYANRVYGIIDNDVTNADLYKSDFTTSVKDLTESKLTNLATALGSAPNEAAKIAAKSAMVEGTKQGWYYPLTRFDGYNNVRYNKGVGDSVVINNLLYTTVYNPDKLYGTVSSCSAKISGGSERQLYCLPYGICMEASSGTGTGGYLPAGQGIQELTLGAYNEENTDLKVLIGNRTITERALEINRAGYGTDTFKNDSNIKDLYPGEESRPTQVGGDGTAGEYIFNERYTMQPRIWYERK